MMNRYLCGPSPWGIALLVSTIPILVTACNLDDEELLPTAMVESEIQNGTVWNPWTQATQTWTRNVVRLNGCTGTLLNYEWVLTAAHCFPGGPGTNPGSITVSHLLADGTTETSVGVELLFHPAVTQEHSVDVALVRLAVPMHPGVATLPLISGGTTNDLVGTTVFCAGYGAIDTAGSCSTSSDCSDNQFCKWGTCMIPNDGPLRTASFEIIADPDNPDIWYQFQVPNEFGQMELPGDSGSSCWNGSGLTGVMKAGNATNYNRQTSAVAVRDWVNQIVNPTILKEVNQPAASCRGIGGAALQYQTSGQAMNATASATTVLCPITRPAAPAFADVVSVPRLWVFDRHPTQDVCCHVQSKNPGSNSILSNTVCSEGDQPGYQTLALPSIRDTYTWSQASIVCSIPGTSGSGNSGLHGYRALLRDR